jgi:hypothetical protein
MQRGKTWKAEEFKPLKRILQFIIKSNIIQDTTRDLSERISFDDVLDLRADAKDLEERIAQLYREMEQDAEPEGGPIADQYADELHKLETQLYRVKKQINDYDMNESLLEKALPIIRKKLGKAPKADKVASKQRMKTPSGLVSYMDFTEQVFEKLTKKHKVGDYVDDFQKSDAKQFKGKSDKKKKQMAVAAYLSKQND